MVKKKNRPQSGNEFIDLYIKESILHESIAAERLVIQIFLFLVPVFILVAVGYFIYFSLAKKAIQYTYIIMLVYLFLTMLYHQVFLRKFSKYLESVILRFVNVFIEVSTISFVIILLYKSLNAEIILTGPLVMVYVIFTIMTGFRYSMKLSMFSGIMSAFQHFIIYLVLIQEIPADLKERLIDLGPSGIFQKSLYLIISGVVSSLICLYTKKNIEKIAIETLEAQKLKVTFGQYVSNEIRDSILSKEIDVNGEEKDGVILFSDIRNFTTILEKKNPKDIIEQLNEYFTEMVKVIADNHGIVNKFIGDAIMCVYGLFKDSGDPKTNAVLTAIKMQKKLAELNVRWQAEKKFVFQMGIGISSGIFLVGNIGSEDRKEFTCIGDVVNTASRLESLTKQSGKKIIISDEVRIGLPDSIPVQFLDAITLKGRTEPTKIYEVEV